MPTFKKFMAIPPPIVPAPIRATDCDVPLGHVLVEIRHIGRLASAKNTCCSAFDWLFCAHWQEQLALARHAFVEWHGGRPPPGRRRCAAARTDFFFSFATRLRAFVEVAGRNLPVVDVDVANLAQRSLSFSELASVADGAFEQIARR